MDKKTFDEITDNEIKRNRARIEGKRESVRKLLEEPVLPSVCRIIFWLMIIIVAAMVAVDINAFLRYDAYLGWGHLLRNAANTGFYSWSVIAVIELLLSAAAARQSETRFLKKTGIYGRQILDAEEKERTGKALKKIKAPFYMYMAVSAAGIAVWGAIYVVSMFL